MLFELDYYGSQTCHCLIKTLYNQLGPKRGNLLAFEVKRMLELYQCKVDWIGRRNTMST